MSDELLDHEHKHVQTTNTGNETLPNSGGILAMGIISIVLAGGIGIILGIIAVSLTGKAERLYRENPGKYKEGSYKNMRAGKVCGIIGMSLAVLIIFIVIAANA
ncbi:MAG: hypothetical protein P8H56_01510 [Crocinitomicaceae bacterium]|nr:hypothetical protein [Crocinitomicaceae bacterium]MDG1657238.1 hypothetical protein [Crocinitomicaceae bacterium]|tara:strand:- start:10954 stop:11265 length:312 start_codon:yes stop_codon:yes gene_type:complete